MYKKNKCKVGKMSGDRLMAASKMADKKLEVAFKPLKLSKMKRKIR